MNKINILCIILLIIPFFLFAESPSDVYGEISDLFQPDLNAGLTAFPTLWVPLGGKYEGMGTAYTAVSDDISYLQSNPSASSTLEYTELAFSHNDWIADTNMEGALFTMRLDDLGIGVGGKFLYVPFTEYDAWGERVSKGYYSESVATINISYNFLSNYYFYGLAVGSNIKLAYRHVPESIYSGQSALMAMIDVGTLTRFNLLKFYSSRDKNFSIGAVVKNLGPQVLDDPLPTSITVGISYSPIQPLTLACDIDVPFSFWPDEYPAEELSLAVGIDVQMTSFFSIQSGFLYKGGNPRVSLGTVLDLKKVSFTVNYTLDLTTQVGTMDRFSIMATLHLGDRGRTERQDKVDEYYTAGLELYANGDLYKAIYYWELALDLDEDFTPAKEMISMAEHKLKLAEEMENIMHI